MNNSHFEAAVDKYSHFLFLFPTREREGILVVAIATRCPQADKSLVGRGYKHGVIHPAEVEGDLFSLLPVQPRSFTQNEKAPQVEVLKCTFKEA